MPAKKTMTVDVEAMTAAIAKLVDDKIAEALQNAQAGAPIYERVRAVPMIPAGPGKAEKVEAEAKKPEVKKAVKQAAPSVHLGDIELIFDSVSARGNRYAGNIKGMIVDKRTGERALLIGCKVFPSTSDEIPEGLTFIAEVK